MSTNSNQYQLDSEEQDFSIVFIPASDNTKGMAGGAYMEGPVWVYRD